MKKFFSSVVILVCTVMVYAQKVEVGADRTVNIARYKTYSWASGSSTANPLIHQMIVDAVDRAMVLKGMTKVELNAELNLVVFAATESDLHISYPSWHPGLNSIATGIGGTSQQWPVTKGTLVVDMLDAKTKNSIWRGTATDTLEHGPTGNMQKDARSVEKKIKKAVEKMFKKFPVAN
jgi:uncharacterized protein DUF4136